MTGVHLEAKHMHWHILRFF